MYICTCTHATSDTCTSFMHHSFNWYSMYILFFHKSGKLFFTSLQSSCVSRKWKKKRKGGNVNSSLKKKKKSKGNPGSTMIWDSKNQVITATKQVKQGQIYRAEKLKPPFSFPKLHSAHYHTKTSPILLLLTRPMYGCISFPCCALYGLVSIVTCSQWLFNTLTKWGN